MGLRLASSIFHFSNGVNGRGEKSKRARDGNEWVTRKQKKNRGEKCSCLVVLHWPADNIRVPMVYKLGL
jgi:hypothetical protein